MGSKKQVDQQRSAFARLRLIHEELDRLGVDASQRSAGVMSKASFLAVAAGVIIAASTTRLWVAQPIIGIFALALACVSLISAAIALRPGSRSELLPQRLVDRYLDSTRNAMSVEREIVIDKSVVLDLRERDLASRAQWVSRGFILLIASTIALCITFAIETLGGN
jgi:hypothetical protein